MKKCMLVWLIFAISATSMADDWSAAPDTQPRGNYGGDVVIPFQLTHTAYGISGHLTYDASKFSNPRIGLRTGQTQQTVVVGQMMSPGNFRFVIYTNPFSVLSTASPIAEITLQVDTSASIYETVSFNQNRAAASNLTFQSVSLAPVTVALNKNAVKNWTVYK